MLRPALVVAGSGLSATWVAVAALGDLRHGALPDFALLYFTATGLYLLALAAIARAEAQGVGHDRGALVAALALALVGRLALLPGDPSLSDDAWRYLWEGRVQLQGANPYALAPADPALAPLRDGAWLRVNHPQVPAVYGPLTELLFAALAAPGGGLLPFKLAFLAADAGVALLLWRLLRRRGRPELWVLAWAWHPLTALELAGQGHLEVVPVLLLLLAVELEEAARPRAAALALGAAVAAKYLPILCLPGFVLRGVGSRARVTRLGLALLAMLLPALPFAGVAGARGPLEYATTWRFNDGPYWLLELALRQAGAAQAFARALGGSWDWAWSQALAKLLVAALVLALLARAARRGAGPAPTAALAGALFLALSPTVHPWYALWVVPFLVPAGMGAAWLHLSLALPLAYEVLLRFDGSPASWEERPWVRACQWVPWAGLLLFAWARSRGNLGPSRGPGGPACAAASVESPSSSPSDSCAPGRAV